MIERHKVDKTVVSKLKSILKNLSDNNEFSFDFKSNSLDMITDGNILNEIGCIIINSVDYQGNPGLLDSELKKIGYHALPSLKGNSTIIAPINITRDDVLQVSNNGLFYYSPNPKIKFTYSKDIAKKCFTPIDYDIIFNHKAKGQYQYKGSTFLLSAGGSNLDDGEYVAKIGILCKVNNSGKDDDYICVYKYWRMIPDDEGNYDSTQLRKDAVRIARSIKLVYDDNPADLRNQVYDKLKLLGFNMTGKDEKSELSSKYANKWRSMLESSGTSELFTNDNYFANYDYVRELLQAQGLSYSADIEIDSNGLGKIRMSRESDIGKILNLSYGLAANGNSALISYDDNDVVILL